MKVGTSFGRLGGRQIAVAGLMLAAVSACGKPVVTDSGSSIVPSTLATTAATTPASTSAPASATPTQKPISAPAGTTPTVKSSSPTILLKPLTLGDKGIGGLALGMTRKQAVATGLIGATAQQPVECAVNHGKRGVDLVYFDKGRVTIITVKSSIKLDSGLGVGDTYRKFHQIYPDVNDPGDLELGRLAVPARGAAVPAHYRVELTGKGDVRDWKVTALALQSDSQPCYE